MYQKVSAFDQYLSLGNRLGSSSNFVVIWLVCPLIRAAISPTYKKPWKNAPTTRQITHTCNDTTANSKLSVA